MTATTKEELPLLQRAPHTPHAKTNHATWTQRFHVPTRLQGMLLVAFSAFTFSLLSTLIKYASYSMTSMETVFWRSFVAWVLNLIAMRVCNVSLKVKRRFWPVLATRCTFGFCSLSLGFYAMQQMVLADASVLIFTSPVMTFFLGALVLHERIDPINLGCALFSFVGVICVSRPTFIFGQDEAASDSHAPVFAVVCALMAAASQAVVYVSMRRLKQLHVMVVINYFLLTGTVVSALSLAFVQQTFTIHLSISVWLAVLGTGFFGFIGQLFLTRGFQLENAGTASVMRYLDVVFVFLWDMTLLHETISIWSAVGALIICACAIIIVLRRMNHHH
ncbi:hypothetical protein Poli38472_005038 [Pythium oligandrum]|uniref:EamA domain-containing protein n=1 Tax=Pythium oligandrum TaxID=41045 RepID=A0A8K1CGR9_PYTOL|nr:hypothetical protein Poli38472_005038 [Pythium oligandrum]|eukprot:TMW62420.1 hypothetical protein Poli38472_005038 [Pythium oligandrum]